MREEMLLLFMWWPHVDTSEYLLLMRHVLLLLMNQDFLLDIGNFWKCSFPSSFIFPALALHSILQILLDATACILLSLIITSARKNSLFLGTHFLGPFLLVFSELLDMYVRKYNQLVCIHWPPSRVMLLHHFEWICFWVYEMIKEG